MAPRGDRDFQWQGETYDFPRTFGVKYVRGAEIIDPITEKENDSLGYDTAYSYLILFHIISYLLTRFYLPCD